MSICSMQFCQNFSAARAATVRSFPLTFDAGLPKKTQTRSQLNE